MQKAGCASVGVAARYEGWSGSVYATYATQFAMLNADKVVNASADLAERIRALGDKAALERAIEAEHDAYVSAIRKVESSKAPASRQAELEKALRSISSPEIRDSRGYQHRGARRPQQS